jgi:hypothetical protein
MNAVPSSYLSAQSQSCCVTGEVFLNDILIPHGAIDCPDSETFGIEYLFPQKSATLAFDVIETPFPFRQIVSLKNK